MAAKESTLVRESKSLAAVVAFEKKKGRKADRAKQGDGYDLISGERKIEVKTIARIQNGFVQLNARQFRVLCSDKDYWVYLVIPGPPSQIFTFQRDEVLPFIRSYIHFDFFYKKRLLSSDQPSN